jgi:predicted transposase/invertase (TIGR01784 family)
MGAKWELFMEKDSYKLKPVDELTFTDDGMFQSVLHEADICAELVERLLHVEVEHVEYPEIEKQIAPYYTTKGIRLDVYLKDQNKIIDIEMQTYPQNSIGKRTRYYQSMIDIDALIKGEPYPQLKESYILFICKKDPFLDYDLEPYGLPCYTFRNICEENNMVDLGDNSIKVIYNSSAYKREKDIRIRDFLYFINTNDPGKDEFSNRLLETVNKIKENEKFRSYYTAMNLHDWDITQLAKKDGAKEATEENARNLFKNGVSKEIIAKSLNLSLEKLEEILREAS